MVAGVSADALGTAGAMWIVAALTTTSGVVVALRMTETPARRRSHDVLHT